MSKENKLPDPDTHCWDDDSSKDVWSYSPELVRQRAGGGGVSADAVLLDRALRAIRGLIEIGAHRGVKPSDITLTIVADIEKRLEAPVAPETMPSRWAWWFEGDDSCHIEATESDCHGEAQSRIDSYTEPGIDCEYFIARTAHPLDTIASDHLAYFLGESIHQDIDMRCADETGADEESLSITKEDKAELGQMVLDFLRARAKVQCWGIDKKTEARHTYVAGGNDETAGGFPS